MLPKSHKHLRFRSRVLSSAVIALGSISFVSAAEIAAVGPVDSLDCAAKKVRVLGIQFRALDASVAEAICSSGQPTELLFVAVRGNTTDAGAVDLISYSLLSKAAYVPGATPVYLRGTVVGPASASGELDVNGAIVSGINRPVLSGAAVEILGTQPLIGGHILAMPSVAASGTEVHSSSGSGILSLSGSGKLSSSGSGVLSSSGSGILSSSGSGKLSSSGSGVLSSSGSGKLSSSGSGKLSSSGSGVLSSSGSGKSTE